MEINVAINSIIDWVYEGKIIRQERVLWINCERTDAVVLDLLNSKSQPRWTKLQDIYLAVNNGLAIKHIGDPYTKSCKNDKHIDKAKKNLNIIRGIVECEPDVYDHELKSAMVKDCVERYKVSKTSVYKYVRKYWKGGKTEYALIPDFDNCGGPGKSKPDTHVKRGCPIGKRKTVNKSVDNPQNNTRTNVGINVTEEIRGVIQAAFDLFYYPNNNPSPAWVLHKMNAEFFSQGTYIKDGVEVPKLLPRNQRPSYPQFYYWFKKLVDPKKAIIQGQGELEYLTKYRELKGNSNQITMGPGFLYQVDWTMADIYLVNKITRTKVLRRPIVYICVDVFSRLITGIWVTLENASWMTAAMVVENVVEDKVAYCKRYGITITQDMWPSNFLPSGFLADRGEFYCQNSNAITERLGPKVDNTAPYRADGKGICEQMFRRFNLKAIHLLPGMVPRHPARWEPDHRLNAKIDIDQFTRLMIKAALYYNLYHEIKDYPYERFMLATSAKAIPIELWDWGLAFRGGHLRDVDPMMVKESLYPNGVAKLTRRGIEFKNKLIYVCENEAINKKIRYAAISGEEKVNVIFDPRTTKYLWIINKRNPPTLCRLKEESSYNDITFEDFENLEDERLQDKELCGTIDNQEQALAELYSFEKAIEKEAEELTNHALASNGLKHPIIRNMKENTAIEIERVRDERINSNLKSTTSKSVNKHDYKGEIPERQEDRFLKLLRGGK